MWLAIVVALAASIFAIAKPQITSLATGVFDNVENVVKGIDTGGGNNNNESSAFTVVGAESSDFADNKIDLTDGNTGDVLGHYSYDSTNKVGKFAFDTEAAKSVDLTNGINIMLPGAGLPMGGMPQVNVTNILSVDDKGAKTSNSANFMIANGQQFQISGTGTNQSLYGVVIEVGEKMDDASGSMQSVITRSEVTSHYEAVKN